jgi:hypothetical protein
MAAADLMSLCIENSRLFGSYTPRQRLTMGKMVRRRTDTPKVKEEFRVLDDR